MKKQFIILSTILCCLVLAVAPSAVEQRGRRTGLNIPFDFVVQGQKLPAGEYTVERVDRSNPSVLAMRDANGATTRVFLTQRAESSIVEKRLVLLFHRCGERYLLIRVWLAGDVYGRQLPQKNPGCAPDSRDTETLIVRQTED